MDTSVRALREKLGNDAMLGLQAFVDAAARQWKDDVLVIAGERFEHRLSHEIGAFRVEVANEFAAMRVDMAKEFAALRVTMANERVETTKEFGAVRVELATTRVSLLKWCFLFWIGQFAAVSGMMAFLLRTIGPR